jgi:hypothetical protein
MFLPSYHKFEAAPRWEIVQLLFFDPPPRLPLIDSDAPSSARHGYADVRFNAHYGLKLDMARRPKSADIVAKVFFG